MASDTDGFEELTLHSEPAFSGNLLRLRIDTVRLPDGGKATREIVQHPGAVAIVPVTADGQLLMVRQWRHPVAKVTLEIPAGTLTPGESPERCAQRELVEEVGYFPGQLDKLTTVLVSPGYSDETIHIFMARQLQHQGRQPHPQADVSWAPDPDENVHLATVPLRKAVALCTQGAIADAKSVAGILLAWERLQGRP